jgi:hypothetical protein
MICSSVCRFRVMAPSSGPISAQTTFLANGLVFRGQVNEPNYSYFTCGVPAVVNLKSKNA